MSIITSTASLMNLIIENWIISVAVLAVFASLCLGLFKGAKHGIRAFATLLILALLALCAYLIYATVRKDWLQLVKFGIAWLPSIIFILAVGLGTLIGIHRGLRKSAIFMLHSVLVAALCLGGYFFCVSSPTVDKFLLDLVNVFIGEGGLQNELGVSSECASLSAVILAAANDIFVDLDEFGILLQENSPYVLTLINLAYRIVFAVIFYVIYLLFTFILYVIYLIFYSERKYKRKKSIRFAQNRSDSSYKKRPLGGGCIGLTRGLVSGLIAVSFIGSVFYIANGGIGASKLPEDFSLGEDYQPIVDIYRSIEGYGDQGIYKVLNAVSDPNDTPYYLFAADIVFSGGLDDSVHDVKGHVKFREELAAYTGFAKNTLALLLKYDKNGEIASLMKDGISDGEKDFEKVLDVFTDTGFRIEFNNLIDNFDSQTYIINFALSLADSVIANADNMDFMQEVDADSRQLLQVMFSRGYLCEVIPDERALINSTSNQVSEYIPPHLTINHLLTKRDAQVILEVVLSVLAGEIDMEDPASLVKNLIPQIEQLSILSTERSKEMDPVLGRLYCYVDNKYLTEEGEDGITYAEIKDESVQWTKEIRALLSVSDGLFTMYEKVAEEGENEDILNNITSLFDESSPDYAENVKIYEELTSVVSDSKLIGKALCSKKIHSYMEEGFKSVSENFYLPAKISYANTYDGEGNLVAHGEAYQLLRGLRLLADKENKELIDSLVDGESDLEDLLKKLSSAISRADPNAPENTLATYLTDSIILRSALSAAIMDNGGDMLKVPALSRERDEAGEVVYLINKPELKQIFDVLPELVDLLLPIINGDEVTGAQVNSILKSSAFTSLLDNGNKIIEGTVANALIDLLGDNGTVVIPAKYDDCEQWVTVSDRGELRKFIASVDVLEIDIESVMDGGEVDGTEIFEKLKSLTDEQIADLISSDVFYYTASKLIDDGKFGAGDDFKVVVPSSSCVQLTGDKLQRVIKRSELSAVFCELKNLGLSSDTTNEEIVKQLTKNKSALKDSSIMSASVVNFIVTHDDICSSLSVPQNYVAAGAAAELQEYAITNIWRKELPNMIDAIDEIFSISSGGEFTFDSEAVTEKTNELLKKLNDPADTRPSATKLEVCYASDIMKNNITKELDSALEGVVDGKVISGAKSGGYYSQAELRALSETADIYELDILEIDNDELARKIKGELLTINVPRADGRSALDIMYPSAIIRYFITDEIDKSLNGEQQSDESLIDIAVRDKCKVVLQDVDVYPESEVSALIDALNTLGIDNIDDGIPEDNFTSVSKYKGKIDTMCASGLVTGIITKKIDEHLTEDKIDTAVKTQIKGNSGAYPSKEIVALIDALDELGIDDFSGFEADFSKLINGLNTAPSNSVSGKTKLDVVYKSDIIVGVFTKTVKDTFDDSDGKLVYHNSANRADLAVLKESEIDALITLLGSADLDKFDVGALSVQTVKAELAPDSNGNPASFLISASFTATVVSNDALYVPSSVCRNKLIDAQEAVRFIDALSALQGDASFDEWDVQSDMILPAAGSREAVLASKIMCATFSHYVFTEDGNEGISFRRDSVEVGSKRIISGCATGNYIAIISGEQLEILFEIIETCTVGNKLQVPTFDSIDSISALSAQQLDALYTFDVTRYSMSSVIIEAFGLILSMPENQQYLKSENCYSIKLYGDDVRWESASVDVVTKEGILALINA